MTDRTQGAGGSVVVTPPVTGTGTLSVSLSATTPTGGSIATGANANMLGLTLTAGSTAVKIKKIAVTQYGLSDTNDLENLKVVDETGLLIGNLVSAVNSVRQAVFTFPTPIDIAANGTKTYYVRAGINSTNGTTGNTVILGVAAATDVTLDSGTVSGTYPIKGNTFSIVATTVGSVSVTNDGSVTDTTPDAGDTNVVLNKFKVTAGSTEDVTIEDMTFLESGTASISDYSNLELWDVVAAKSLGEISTWNAEGKAHFKNLNIKVEKGKSYRFELRTDVLSGSGLTMNADLVDGSDVLMGVKGNSFAFYLTPSVTGSWTGKGGSGATVTDQTINSGSLNVSVSSKSPAAGNVSAGDDILVGAFSFEARGEQVLVTNLVVNFDLTTMLYSEVTAVKVKDSAGSIVAGPVDAATVSGGGEVTFSDSFIVPIGQNDYYVYATISTNVSAGDIIQTDIDAAGDITCKGYSTGTSITPTVSSAAAASLTVSSAALQAVTLTTPALRDIAPGVQDMVWMTGALRASNSGEDIVVTTVVLEDTLGDAGDNANDIDNVEIWADLTNDSSTRGDVYETKVSNTEQFVDSAATDETLSFTLSSAITVPKNGEIKIAVLADLAAGATATDTHTISFDTDSGDVSGYGKSTGITANATPTGAGQTMTVAANGTLTLTVDGSSPSAKLVYGGQTDVELAIFRLAANNVENLDVDSIKITDDGSDNAVATYKFYVGTTLLGTISGGATAEIFLADNTVYVPANDNIKVTVKGDMSTVDGSTVANGNTAVVTVAAAGDIDTTGKSSGAAVDSTQTSVDAAIHTLYNAYPSVAFANDTPGGTLIPNANLLVAKINITANGNDDITFQNGDGSSLLLQVAASRGDASGGTDDLIIKDKNGNTLCSTSTYSFVTTTEWTCDFSTNSLTVAKGTTEVIYVYADTASFEDSGDSIQIWLDDTAGDIDWGINGSGSFNKGDIIFRGDKYGGAFSKA